MTHLASCAVFSEAGVLFCVFFSPVQFFFLYGAFTFRGESGFGRLMGHLFEPFHEKPTPRFPGIFLAFYLPVFSYVFPISLLDPWKRECVQTRLSSLFYTPLHCHYRLRQEALCLPSGRSPSLLNSRLEGNCLVSRNFFQALLPHE